MKTIAINGASGFLGGQICEYFKDKYSLLVIKRDDYLIEPNKLADKIKGVDIIINLAGVRIKPVMSKKYEKDVYESRINTTKNLRDAIDLLITKSELFISFSAIGIYQYDVLCDETAPNFCCDFWLRFVKIGSHLLMA